MVPDGPADKAGLRPTRRDANRLILGDVIVAIEGQRIENTKDLFATLAKYQVGDTIGVTVLRGDEETKVDVTLESIQ